MKISSRIEENIKEIKNIFKNDSIVIYREFYIRDKHNTRCFITYIDGMANSRMINDNILFPIMETCLEDITSKYSTGDIIFNKYLPAGGVKKVSTTEEAVNEVLMGNTVLFIDNSDEAIRVDTVGWEKRPVSEPDSEKLVRGPREGLTESLITNMALIRRKIKNPDLKFQFRELGEVTKTSICVCYIENIVSQKILDEVNIRLDKINIDGILDSGYIQEFIKDSPFTPFKTIGDTERPDVAASKLLEGRVVILCDGTPFALTMPFVFLEYFLINEDYYNNFYYATINRFIRWVGLFFTTSVPAIYTALVTFHQEMIPTSLLLSISASRQGLPFPTIVEALGMLFVFELLREAGVRIPTVVGQTISIVGALVIGQSAVEARLISAPMIIVSALTGISSFLAPKMGAEIIIIRVALLLMASFIGLYGYIFGVIFFIILLSSIRSFGVPYMINISSMNPQDQKDVLFRSPWPFMYKRPKLFTGWNKQRQKKS